MVWNFDELKLPDIGVDAVRVMGVLQFHHRAVEVRHRLRFEAIDDDVCSHAFNLP
jgi:hypothetical protein